MGLVLHQSGHGHSHGLSGGHSHKDHSDHNDDEMHDGETKKVNINVRAAFIHVLGDLVQSVGVLIAAIIIKIQVCVCMCVCVCVCIRKRPNHEFFAEPEPNRTEPPIFFAEPNFCAYDLRSYQLKLIKMLAELANLNH